MLHEGLHLLHHGRPESALERLAFGPDEAPGPLAWNQRLWIPWHAALWVEASLLTEPGADADSAERAIVALVRGIAAHPREVVLMLDDLHHLGSREALSALQWMLDFSPPNLHLVLASRGTPPLSLARLRARRIQPFEVPRIFP